MAVALYSHPDCAPHAMGAGHPECPERLAAARRGLEKAGLMARLEERLAEEAPWDYLARGHAPDYLALLQARSPAQGLAALDADTAMNPHSLHAALLAAGAVKQAVEAVLAGEFERAFCLVRPPGHHAEHDRAMGFCFLGNIALGAIHALALGCERVALVDFDVHHGNGSQDLLAAEPRALLCSSFQHPLYPYSGTGATPAHIVNATMAAGGGGRELRAVWEDRFLPALEAHRPQLILISAGFDAHRRDPLAGMAWETEDYAWLSRELVALARRHAQGRLVSSLEGGYDFTALEEGVAAHVGAMLEG
ncbi:MAG: histone deacetylase family protein [Gammaproteobacteria bacterium]|nr:histone deacetylase family protein [Gammaproteobacteria bacterium]